LYFTGKLKMCISLPSVVNVTAYSIPILNCSVIQWQFSKAVKGGGALCAGNAVALLVFGPVMP